MAAQWTSRRRVEAALSHREPDRVPADMTITQVPYDRLRDYLGLPPDQQRGNRFGEVTPGLDLLDVLGIDITFVKLGKAQNWQAPPPLADGTQLDEWGVGRQRVDLPGGGWLLEVSHSPLRGLPPAEIDLDSYPWPDPGDPGYTAGLQDEAARMHATGLALMGRFGGTIMEQAAFIRGYDDWLMDLVLYPDFARDLMEHINDVQIRLDEAGIAASAPYLSIFKLSGEDLGMQDRPLFSHKTWQEVLRPVLRRRWQAARQALDRCEGEHVRLMLHSDGAIRSFIPNLIEDGIDVLDPIQVQCAGMEPAALKHDFRGRITFHGAIDAQQVLPFYTPEQVRAETVRILRALGPGGGFIVAPVHNVQPDVPPENLAALFQAVREHGRYPLG